MLFTSPEFYLFLVASMAVFYLVSGSVRWLVLLTSGYIFYGSWQPWFLLVLIYCTVMSWLAGLYMAGASPEKKKRTLAAVVCLNILPLLVFKHANFFNESVNVLLEGLGWAYRLPNLDILLPVGISFFTFQAVSYCADVYSGRLPPERNAGLFALYLSFFPKLISGPIERGAHLLPQLRGQMRFDKTLFVSGVQLFIWGIFKKVVIADRIAMYVDMVFKSPDSFYGKTVVIAFWMYSLQIYCDFTAYMAMAIGCGRMFGVELSPNFNFPYMARSIGEFWRRWHITLTSWFRDYVYIPLGGNRTSPVSLAINVMLVFLVSGLWHGAAWNFVFWGGLHGIFYLVGRSTALYRQRFRRKIKLNGKLESIWQVMVTFQLVTLAWVFFRAGSIGDAFRLIANMLSRTELPVRMMSSQFSTILSWGAALFFIFLELLLYRADQRQTNLLNIIPPLIRYPGYAAGLLIIALLGVSTNEFIYFQF